MAIIKIKLGGCGIVYTDAHGNARHALKTPESGAFECDDAQASRLVKLGVAEYVNGLVWQQVEDPEPEAGEQLEQEAAEAGEQTDDTQETEQAAGHLDAEQLAEMDYNELKKLAADMGVKPVGKTKADYIAALAAAEVIPGDEDTDEDEDNELPDLNAADPE